MQPKIEWFDVVDAEGVSSRIAKITPQRRIGTFDDDTFVDENSRVLTATGEHVNVLDAGFTEFEVVATGQRLRRV